MLAGLAIPWLLLGCGSAALTARFLAAAESGVAEVVSSRERPSTRGAPWWTTTFFFKASDGTRLTASWTGERRFLPGEAARVFYRRTPFLRVQPDDKRATWGWAWVFAAAGGVHLLVGGALLLAGGLLRRRAAPLTGNGKETYSKEVRW